MPAGLEHVVDVCELALVQLAEHLLAQHLAEADDRVQRRAQLVRHVRQELRLVLARELELALHALQLVARAVHLRGEAADLVPVRDLEAAGEVAGADLVEPVLGAAERPHHRPREEQPEREREHEAGGPHADQEVARTGERAPVGGDERIRAGTGLACARADLRNEGSHESVGAAEGIDPTDPVGPVVWLTIG